MTGEETNKLYCRRCQYPIVVPSRVSADVAAAISGGPIQFIKLLREHLGIGLTDAKALANHATHDGTCHHCRAPLPTVAAHICGCRAVNVNLALLVPSQTEM